VELVDVDEPTMQALLDAILAQDMADFGALIRGVLLRKGATPDDLLLLTLASLILNGDTEEIDVVSLADVLRTIASFPLEESFSELEGLVELIGTELEVSNELIASASRILENFIRYCLESWEAIGQEAGELFGENDDTLHYVLAWVTALYVQSFAELNEEETSMSKSGGAVSKQESQEREAAVKQLVTEAELNAVIESFNLDSLETYGIIDVDYLLGSLARGEFNAAEYFETNQPLREAILAPIEAIATVLETRIDGFAITKAVMRSASGAATRATGCSTGCETGDALLELIFIIPEVFLQIIGGSCKGCVEDQYAYSFQGDGKKPDAADVLFAAQCFANMGYTSTYLVYPGNITESTIKNRINREIVFFSTHGWQNGIQLRENQLYIIDGNAGNGWPGGINIENINLNKPKLIVYSACETAAGTDNLAKATYDSGADCVIGWPVNVGEAIYIWTDRFCTALKANDTINQAVAYADAYNYNEHFGSQHDNTVMRSRKIYGDGSQKLKIN